MSKEGKAFVRVDIPSTGESILMPVVFVEVAKLRESKARDYRNSDTANLADYFPFGLLSHVQMVWTKALRLLNLVSTKRTPNHEGIRDTLKDMINYACFAIEDIDGNLEGRDIAGNLEGRGTKEAE